MKKIVVFGASSSRFSINKRLASYAAALMENARTEILDLNDYELPLFSVDREKELGHPEPAKAFFAKIRECDGLIISFAEHNGSYTAAYKNLYDWCSRIDPKVYRDKPMLLLSTSPGHRGGSSVLETATQQIPRFGGIVVEALSLPDFEQNFDFERERVSNPIFDEKIRSAVGVFAARLAAEH